MLAVAFDTVWAILTAALAAGAIVGLVFTMRRDTSRELEDEARAFFDLHGHWPDEDPGARAE
jgi:hypothetical protein